MVLFGVRKTGLYIIKEFSGDEVGEWQWDDVSVSYPDGQVVVKVLKSGKTHAFKLENSLNVYKIAEFIENSDYPEQSMFEASEESEEPKMLIDDDL